MTKTKYSLRTTKYSKTKIALARVFFERLKSTPFSDISIKDVCRAVEISEGTFYNYFPSKTDLARFMESLVLLKVSWEVREKKGELNSFEMIGYAFDLMAIETSQPFLFYEMVALYTKERIKFKNATSLTEADKYFAFPECRGIEKIKHTTVEELFLGLIEQALKDKMISRVVKKEDILLNLMSILIGVPLIIDIDDFHKINKLYRSQLNLLWGTVDTLKNKRK